MAKGLEQRLAELQTEVAAVERDAKAQHEAAAAAKSALTTVVDEAAAVKLLVAERVAENKGRVLGERQAALEAEIAEVQQAILAAEVARLGGEAATARTAALSALWAAFDAAQRTGVLQRQHATARARLDGSATVTPDFEDVTDLIGGVLERLGVAVLSVDAYTGKRTLVRKGG